VQFALAFELFLPTSEEYTGPVYLTKIAFRRSQGPGKVTVIGMKHRKTFAS